MTAIVPMPIARSALASSTMRPMLDFTYGQWLQMKATSVPFGPRTSASE